MEFFLYEKPKIFPENITAQVSINTVQLIENKFVATDESIGPTFFLISLLSDDRETYGNFYGTISAKV